MSGLEDKQITKDYSYVNPNDFDIPLTGFYTLHTFDVPAGETLDFECAIASHQGRKNNALWLRLYQDDQVVSVTIDDGQGGDDNNVVAMFYKAKMNPNRGSSFKLLAWGGSHPRTIMSRQFQLGYKTYGVGHVDIEHIL